MLVIEPRSDGILDPDAVISLTHELKCPLTCIMGYTHVLLSGKGTLAEEQEREHLLTILRMTQRMKRLIDDVLECAQREHEGLALQVEVFPLDDLMHEVVTMLTPVAQEHGIRIHRERAPRVYVRGDRDRIAEVFLNLLGNAVRFTPRGGVVRIETEADSQREIVRVIDEGNGVDPDCLPNLFHRFSKVDRRKGGTGLGLYLTRRILEAHGQSILCTSEPGRGATFTFTLPTVR